MDNQVQKFIEKKKRKKLRKKVVMIVFLITGVTLGVMFKGSFFNINDIKLQGNVILDEKNIVKEKEILGQNIFLFDNKKLENIILSNPYIQSVNIKKELPNKLKVAIEERKMIYKIKEGDKNYILNKSLVLMDIKDSLEDGVSLIELQGITLENKVIGETIIKDEGRIKAAEILGENLLDKEKKMALADNVEINSLNNIVMNKGNIKIILGNLDNLEEKYNKALKILSSEASNMESGYIDVSFNGNPVIKEEEAKTEKKDN
ncbi:MAG: cell division protein FtsQ/DivIB [Sarcina sp.]